MSTVTKEEIQEDQYLFPYHHLAHERDGAIYIFQHLFWGLDHYSYISVVIENLLKQPFVSLIDIGCGEGRIITEIRKTKSNAKLTGVDVSKKALKFARAFADQDDFHVHDITALPFGDNLYEVAISCEVIEHIKPEHIPAYVKNIHSTLASGGRLLLTTPTTNIKVGQKHYQHFTKELLVSYLNNHFEISETIYLNKKNYFESFLRKILANRLYISNSHTLNKIVYSLYKRFCLYGDEKNSSRIFIIATKK